MNDLIYHLINTDFMQALFCASVFFILPLEKRSGWKKRAVILAAAGGLIDLILINVILIKGWGMILTVVYYLAPLVMSAVLFGTCCRLSIADSIYGMSCAYAVQHIGFCITIILWGESGTSLKPIPRIIAEWIVYLAVSGLCCHFFARQLPDRGRYRVSVRKTVFTAAMVLSIALVLNYIARQVWEEVNPVVYAVCMLYDLFSCLFILWIQAEQRRETSLEAEARAERILRQQSQEQYELSKENIAIINQKCHDLKHQIAALRFVKDQHERDRGLQEIEKAAMIYDSVVKTGNEALDTVLTEKSLICERNSISWTCMADGELLEFMSPVDLYTLFGNALDNAIEGSRTVKETERRTVAVTVRDRYGAAFIQIENYYGAPVHFEQGLPVTTKQDKINHGYGLKSIRSVAERYGGTMDIVADGKIFLLSILIPRKMSSVN